MARARLPRQKGESTQPEILRAIRLGDNGDVYGPGEEDEFLAALEDHIDEHNDNPDNEDNQLDLNEELHRLSAGGSLVNFRGVELDEDDYEESDHDLHANQQAARAILEGAAPGDESTPARTGRRRTGRISRTTRGVQSSKTAKRLDDGSDAALDEAAGKPRDEAAGDISTKEATTKSRKKSK